MKRKLYLFLFSLASITFVVLFAEFFHTETSLVESDDCPICLWQQNALAIDQIYVLILAINYVLIRQLVFIHARARHAWIIHQTQNRDPPPV